MAKAGYEMIFNYTRKQFKNSQDAVVCALHWGMVSHGFLCVGEGENPPRKKVQGSEMLPEGWNAEDGLYALLYQPADSTETYLLKIICNGDELLVHLARLRDDKVASSNFSCRQYANKDLSNFKSAYKNLDGLQKRFEKDVLNAVLQPAASGAGQRQQRRGRDDDDDDPLRVTPRCRLQPRMPDWDEDNFAVGRGDLDPLAGGRGGGMFMDPRRGPHPGHGTYPSAGIPQGLPRGAVPPGARFDPYGPPDFSGPGPSRARSGPDPDHLPPPGYDDMYM